MRLTADIMRAAYAFLRETPPFHRWRLPAPNEVVFLTRTGRDATVLGCHTPPSRGVEDRHTIGVSARRVSHLTSLLPLLAHEMTHVAVSVHYPTERSEHGAAWQLMAAQVCRHHGFDPLYF